MKKTRKRLAALLAAIFLSGVAVAESVHEHSWSAWMKNEQNKAQEIRTCLECSVSETRAHEWGEWMDQGDGAEKHVCVNCGQEEFRKAQNDAGANEGGTPTANPGEGGTPTADPGEGGTPTANPGEGGTPTVNPGEGNAPTADPGKGSTPTANPGEGGTPTADPGEGGTPTADPGEGSTPTADPGEGGTPTADPGEGGTPTADPGESSTPTADPGESNTPTVNPGESSTPPPNSGGDSAPLPLLDIRLASDAVSAKAGEVLTYTITLTNSGTGASEADTVRVEVPSALTVVEASQGYSGGEWPLRPLAAGESEMLWIRAMVTEAAAHGDTLTVTAHTGGGLSSSAQTAVQEEPMLSVTCAVDREQAAPGEALQYTVTLTNAGRGPAEGAAVQISPPQGVETPDAQCPEGSTYDAGLWRIGSLAAGASLTLTLQTAVRTDAAPGELLTLTAAQSAVQAAMRSGKNASGSSASTLVAAPVLSAGISVDSRTAATGSVVNYIVTLKNTGNAAAKDVEVNIGLPAANLLVDAPAPGTPFANGIWTVSEIKANETLTLKLRATVVSAAPGETIAATAAVGQGTPAQAAFTGVNAAVNLSIVKTADRVSAEPGSDLCYTVTVTNNGSAPISSITVSESPSAGLLLTGKELTEGTAYDETAGVWTIPTLAAGANATLVLKTMVLDAEAGKSLVNTAEITGVAGSEPDPHPAATASVMINAVNYGFLTVNKTVAGSGASRSRDFPFQVTFADAAGKAADGLGLYVRGSESRVFDTSEPLTFTLRHDETVWIGVPAGLSYTVTETDTRGYTLTARNDKGVIPIDELIEVSFVNERQRNTEIPKTGYADQAPGGAEDENARPVPEAFSEEYARNDDLVGWLKAGEDIDLPVVQSDNTFYLDHGFTGEEDRNGTLFLNMNNQLLPPDDVLLIHGHNMKDGSMFGTLARFESYDYACEYPIVSFQTIYDDEPVYYVPVSVFNASMLPDHSSYFDITQIVFPDDEEENDPSAFRQSSAFRAYLEELRRVSLWDSPADVNADDKLLMLVTCSYDLEDGRLMVACRRLREGETPDAAAALFRK